MHKEWDQGPINHQPSIAPQRTRCLSHPVFRLCLFCLRWPAHCRSSEMFSTACCHDSGCCQMHSSIANTSPQCYLHLTSSISIVAEAVEGDCNLLRNRH